MVRETLVDWKKQLERQQEAELRVCRAKWRRKLDAIELLLREGAPAKGKQRSEPQAVAFAEVLEETLDPKRGVMDAIRRTLANARGIFTASTLVGMLNKTGQVSVTERHVANPLWRLHQAGEIRLVERGRGRKPSVYLKI